jgi:hypothetical protein
MKTNTFFPGFWLPLIFIMSSNLVSGQIRIDSLATMHDTSSFLIVRFHEGSTYYGKFRQFRNDTLVLLTTDLGPVSIPAKRIKKITKAEYMVMKKGRYWFPTPLPGRYLFAPSAFSLKAGEGYYQNTMLVLNSFNVGVTNWFSVGGGIEFLTTIGSITAGEFAPSFYLTPKIGFRVAPNFRAGAGVIYAQLGGDAVRLANFYGVFTYGNPDYNISAGIGWGTLKTGSEKAEFQKSPLVTISGTARIARKLAFVTENWFIPYSGDTQTEYYPLFSYGLRFFGESLSVDFAFINNKDIVEILFIGIPYVSFSVKF